MGSDVQQHLSQLPDSMFLHLMAKSLLYIEYLPPLLQCNYPILNPIVSHIS